MKPLIQLQFPSGHVYQVPTAAIQAHAAAAGVPDEHPVSYISGMSWADIAPHAKLVEFDPPPLDTTTASFVMVDQHTQPQPPTTGDAVIGATVEWLLAVSGAHGQMFQSYALEDAHGAPAALISITTGGPAVVRAATANISAFAEAVQRVLTEPDESTPIQ